MSHFEDHCVNIQVHIHFAWYWFNFFLHDCVLCADPTHRYLYVHNYRDGLKGGQPGRVKQKFLAT